MENIAPALLEWFYKNHRVLPFRTDPTPYHVWLSEIMLQQTRVAAVLDYYRPLSWRPCPPWPTLAAVEEDRLHEAVGGPGLLQPRAQPAKGRPSDRAGATTAARCPPIYEGLLKALPGVGDYTAGAIASISLRPARACGGRQRAAGVGPHHGRRRRHRPAGHQGQRCAPPCQVDAHRPDAPGDFNQALMELGAHGVPAQRRAPVRPVPARRTFCRARAAGTAPELPSKGGPQGPAAWRQLTVALVETDMPHRPRRCSSSSGRKRACWRGCGSPSSGRAAPKRKPSSGPR